MSKAIRINEALLKKLQYLAGPLERPQDVIQKLVDKFERDYKEQAIEKFKKESNK